MRQMYPSHCFFRYSSYKSQRDLFQKNFGLVLPYIWLKLPSSTSKDFGSTITLSFSLEEFSGMILTVLQDTIKKNKTSKGEIFPIDNRMFTQK